MSDWKSTFARKLNDAQRQFQQAFETALDQHVEPAFHELEEFLGNNGFRLTVPMRDPGQRSYKFELSENAYVLVIFRFQAIGQFELRNEMFVPGHEPVLTRSQGHVADVDRDWAMRRFQDALDGFVDRLGGGQTAHAAESETLVAV